MQVFVQEVVSGLMKCHTLFIRNKAAMETNPPLIRFNLIFHSVMSRASIVSIFKMKLTIKSEGSILT